MHSIWARFSILFTAALMALSHVADAQFYNGLQMDFGKNRVQYQKFDWQLYRFDRFDVYFYVGGQPMAEYTMRCSDRILRDLEKQLDYTMEKRMEVVVYNKLSDMRQSNIGLATDATFNTGGVTHIVGTKLIVYFDGDYRNFETQLKAGFAQVMVNQMMYGGSFRDVIRSSTLLTLPEWYTNGLISYLSRDWDPEIDNRVKDGILSGRWKNLNRLTGEEATLAGHSIWKYTVETYGRSVLSNILYMTRISRNADNGFQFVLGLNLKSLASEWHSTYDQMYYKQDQRSQISEQNITKFRRRRPQPNCVYMEPKLSPDGRFVAYVQNDMGRVRVIVQDLEKRKKKRILKSGFRSYEKTDHSNPVVAWHPSGKLVSMIGEFKGKLRLTQYNLETKERTHRPIHFFSKITSLDHSDDGRNFLFSAVLNGRSDIFIYAINANTWTQVTNDIWTDQDARFIDRSQRVIFSSNRPIDTLRLFDEKILPLDAYNDIFIYDIKGEGNTLRRVTQTPLVHDVRPTEYGKGLYSYLSDDRGVMNRNLARLDSTISYIDTTTHYRYYTTSRPLTRYKRNIEWYDVDTLHNRIAEVVFRDGNWRINLVDRAKELATTTVDGTYSGFKRKATQKPVVPTPTGQLTTDRTDTVSVVPLPVTENKPAAPGAIDINNYSFEPQVSGEPKEEKPAPDRRRENTDGRNSRERRLDQVMARMDSLNRVLEAMRNANVDFALPPQRIYEISFRAEDVTTQLLDNNFSGNLYQRFTGAPFYTPGVNANFKLGIVDILEDYRAMGGFRFSYDLSGTEYIVSAQHLKRRLDHRLTFMRQAFQSGDNIEMQKVYSHTLTYQAKWPFSEFASLRGSVFGRNDNTVFKSVSDRTLEKPDEGHWMAGAKIEYVFDNTLSLGTNLYRGMRAKVWGEYYQEVESGGPSFFVLGFDARHYTKVHRELIWANRLAASTSFGDQKLIYYMGGVDGWFMPSFNDKIKVDFTQNYAYQTIGTNLRGFQQNIRNGNSMAVFNSELRWPIIRYLMNRPVKSDLLYNLQILAFGDIGTAWTGSSPFSDENTFNREVIQAGSSVRVVIKNRREPIVGGFGLGLRTKILGYFIRVDYAWGVDNRKVQNGRWYLSLALDF
jgi:hypothetical protein